MEEIRSSGHGEGGLGCRKEASEMVVEFEMVADLWVVEVGVRLLPLEKKNEMGIRFSRFGLGYKDRRLYIGLWVVG